MYFNYKRLRKVNLLRLRYFIGELFLIVISILIAVQINDLNQKRIQKNKEIQLLNLLVNDLNIAKEKSIEIIKAEEINFSELEKFLSSKASRQSLLNNVKIDSIFSSLMLGSMLSSIPAINAYTDMKYSGQTRLISNDSIRLHFTELENSLNTLKVYVDDRLSVQQINIDKFLINEINFLSLLKGDPNLSIEEYGQNLNYSILFEEQFVLNAIAVKLTFTDGVLKRRQEVLNEINNLIHLIKVELEY